GLPTWGRPARPRHLARDRPAGAEPRRVAHRDRRRARIERPDVTAGTTAGREPESAALAYGEAVHARVPPELAPRLVHDGAGAERLRRRVALDEAGRVAPRHEADLHALGLVGHREPERGRLRAHLRPSPLAGRDARVREV